MAKNIPSNIFKSRYLYVLFSLGYINLNIINKPPMEYYILSAQYYLTAVAEFVDDVILVVVPIATKAFIVSVGM